MNRHTETTRRSPRCGITLVEVLVVIAIIGLLAAIGLPAVQFSREVSRRMTCASHLHQIAIATDNYVATHDVYPGDFGSDACPLTGLLPYIDQTPLFQVVTGANAPDGPVHPPIYICPSDPLATVVNHSLSYVMNDGNGLQAHGHNGMFNGRILPDWTEPGGPLRLADVTDGLSNTAAFSEWLIEETYRVNPERKTNPKEFRTAWYTNTAFYAPNDLELFANECLHNRVPNPNYQTHVPLSQPDLNGGSVGYHHVLPPNSPSCWNGPPGGIRPPEQSTFRLTSASSLHPRGANLLMADGVVRFVSNDIDRRVWSAWGSRNGNETASNGH